jgi:hypothetical protein
VGGQRVATGCRLQQSKILDSRAVFSRSLLLRSLLECNREGLGEMPTMLLFAQQSAKLFATLVDSQRQPIAC